MDRSVFRFDFSPITGTETTDEGYLRVWCRAARTGTQTYRRADGTQVREYRPEEEVSNPESLATFGMRPVTLEHPPVLLDSNNTSKFQKGYTGSQVRFNDGFVEVALVVTDNDTIASVNRGDAQEVSAGYRVDYDPTPGETPEGESYDGVQRNIRVNHVAIVRRGRAGPDVRLLLDRMDADAAVAVPTSYPPKTTPPISPMATVKLDGLEIDLPTEAASAVQSSFRDLTRQLSAAQGEVETLTQKLDSLQSDLETAIEEKEIAEGRADAYEARLDGDESPEDGTIRIDMEQLDELVAQRLDTLTTLSPAFPDDFKFDGIGEEDLYAEAYSNLIGEEPPEGTSHDYIVGVVEGVLAARSDSDEDEDEDEEYEDEEVEEEEEEEELPPRTDSASSLRESLRGAGAPRLNVADKQRRNLEDAWKTPLTAHSAT